MQDIRAFVEEYVAAATGPDPERHIALFRDDAVVHDDGRTLRGLAEVRRWREETPNVDYDLLEVAGTLPPAGPSPRSPGTSPAARSPSASPSSATYGGRSPC
ncbi:nuclear transport factor 2 family protein [Streptomyces sp. PU10]|uniref:nuclear transport factor 2 family protein n=1 Tax=unclassified Streptomyces TaxID=2593676 RepID=UPI0020CB6240|nr:MULTISPECIES: nuclear transport factor 2 family protein [unclassified Streptomyces]MDU0251823.1 nuclear transport factor 2 family protein [Streptomyces sp. PU10]